MGFGAARPGSGFLSASHRQGDNEQGPCLSEPLDSFVKCSTYILGLKEMKWHQSHKELSPAPDMEGAPK